MLLKKITLLNFRNYGKLEWEPCGGMNLITGPNAQGKTNLLEAIFFSGLGYSFRRRDRDVVRWGYSSATIQASYRLLHADVDVHVDIDSEGRKKIYVNGVDDTGRDMLPGRRSGVVLFRPDDLQIIKGPPARRREFIDNDLGLVEPVYRSSLQSYRRVVLQRNNLLRAGGGPSSETLKIWNEYFYRCGADVLARRIGILKKFFPLVRRMYDHIAGNGEELDMKYMSTVKITGAHDARQLAADFAAEGKAREKEELYKKQTLIGPHRDDIVFFLNKKDIRYFGSQGQIRSLVLALKAAQMELFRQTTGEQPVLLLDDVLMELDGRRQNCLMQLFSSEVQSFATSTQLTGAIARRAGGVYLINGGIIKEE